MNLYKNHIYEVVFNYSEMATSFTAPTTTPIPILYLELADGTFIYKQIRPRYVEVEPQTYAVVEFLAKDYGNSEEPIVSEPFLIIPSEDFIIDETDFGWVHDMWAVRDVTQSFVVFFLQNNAEPNRVDKRPYLNIIKKATGTLRESSSLVNPQITFEWDSGVAPNFNYVYIPTFGRFYFVDNPVFLANNLWMMNLSCDPLMSYKNEILSNNAYIERQEFAYDLSVVDELLTSENRITITETEYTNTFFFTDITDRYSHTYESASPVVVAIGGIASYTGGTTDPTPDTSSRALRKLPWETFGLGLVTLYSMSPKALNDWMMSGNMSQLETIFTDLGEYIVGCKCFPFDVTQLATSSATDNPVKIGNKNATGLTAIRMNAFNNIVTIVSSFSVSRIYDDFRDYAPYTKVSIFLPYIGYVDLPTNDVMGKTSMTIEYAFDLIDGTCQAFIRTGNRIIVATDKSPCAIDLPINQKNNSERLRNLLLGSLNILSGGVSSAIGNASGSKTAMKGISGMMGFMTEHVTKGRITGGWQSMNSPTSVTLVVETQRWVNVDMDEFKKLHGRPCHKTYDLVDLVGFTQVGKIHLENLGTATESEINEIESLLKTGVIL